MPRPAAWLPMVLNWQGLTETVLAALRCTLPSEVHLIKALAMHIEQLVALPDEQHVALPDELRESCVTAVAVNAREPAAHLQITPDRPRFLTQPLQRLRRVIFYRNHSVLNVMS